MPASDGAYFPCDGGQNYDVIHRHGMRYTLCGSVSLKQTREAVCKMFQLHFMYPPWYLLSSVQHSTLRIQVVKESMRMFPVSASGLGRYTAEPTVLGGYHIPAGCEVQVIQATSLCQ